jgi:putative solute:sodium symporter small subunit
MAGAATRNRIGTGMQASERHQRYWRSNLRMTGVLLAIWFVATFAVSWFARELQTPTVLGFPFSFFMAAQGALLVYLLLVAFYAWRMAKLDEIYGVGEDA